MEIATNAFTEENFRMVPCNFRVYQREKFRNRWLLPREVKLAEHLQPQDPFHNVPHQANAYDFHG
jgi:hypothetical protein